VTRLRILVISSDTFPPARVDVSVLFGVELAKRGHEIDWILQSEAPCTRPYVTPWGSGRVWVGATDPGHTLFSRVRKHVLGIANDCRLFACLHKKRYDAVEVKDKFLSGLVAIIACRLFRTRFIYWLSYPFPEFYLMRARDGTAPYPWLYFLRGKAFEWLLYKCLLRAADHVFVQSEQMRLDVAAKGIPVSKMTVVPMGIDVDMFSAMEESADRRVLPAGIPCVLYLGSLSKVRRVDFLFRVLVLVQAAIPAVRLYVVGRGDEGDDRSLLEQEAARLGLQSSIVFVDQMPQSEALRYVQEADVCCSPLYPSVVLRAGDPTKLVEYMAMGKAVVANDHPEQKRLIDSSRAGYCVAYQEEPFADAIVSILKNPAEARLMGQRGRNYARERRAYAVIADTVEKQLLTIAEGGCSHA